MPSRTRPAMPWKIAAMLGPSFLLRYALGLLTLDQAVARLGALADVKAAAVRAQDGLAAVDGVEIEEGDAELCPDHTRW